MYAYSCAHVICGDYVIASLPCKRVCVVWCVSVCLRVCVCVSMCLRVCMSVTVCHVSMCLCVSGCEGMAALDTMVPSPQSSRRMLTTGGKVVPQTVHKANDANAPTTGSVVLHPSGTAAGNGSVACALSALPMVVLRWSTSFLFLLYT